MGSGWVFFEHDNDEIFGGFEDRGSSTMSVVPIKGSAIEFSWNRYTYPATNSNSTLRQPRYISIKAFQDILNYIFE